MKNQGVRNDLLEEIEKLSKAPDLAEDETWPNGPQVKN